MSAKLDLTKPMQTRDGREAQAILAPDGFLYGWYRGGHHACNGFGRGKWDGDGRYYPSSQDVSNGSPRAPSAGMLEHAAKTPNDLVNIPEKRTIKVWMNIYGAGAINFSGFWPTRHEADSNRGGGRIACIEREITYTVGEGLES